MPTPRVSADGEAMPATALMEITPSFRRALESLMDGLVLVLDELDGDVDLEPDQDSEPDLDDDVTAVETYGLGFRKTFHPGDAEPSLGASESCWPFRTPGTRWDRTPTPLRADECEDVSEDEGAQCDDEGDLWSDGPADKDALSLEFGEADY